MRVVHVHLHKVMTMETKALPFMIYAEMTPNPASMKFVANRVLVEGDKVYEYQQADQADSSPLAQRLFSFPFVKGVFIAQNFITISKMDGVEWEEITMELRDYVANYLNAGYEVVQATAESTEAETEDSGITDHSVAETPVEEKIIEILDDYVRPAVEGDGGAIHFKSFENGTLTVVLKGSCSGCPSSTVTLKAGIQGLFERMLPEVKEVVAEEL